MRTVQVVAHDPTWADAHARAAEELHTLLGPRLVALHAIGSTAVPGLAAKPILDLLGVVADLADADACNAALASLGYEAMGEYGISGRRYFRRDNAQGERTHHLHVFAEGSPHIRRHLAFRDYLRAHPGIALDYGRLKLRLASLHPSDMPAYIAGKDSFVRTIEAQALAWVNALA
ncbi:GrpB family protein [Inhella gelatinilytica]|uniref:GrpB family protein n=1 Tax=Inhella gelatinilytica TaxID=2795030 RepID=A0A931NFI8_9BURK|nr:GrpB family protein [Inhella gelatinilytica]MBH9554285.1 GrpB family protein [Inhella gelatinilytica]